jgi:8-oxo-dGTP diphosphatase
VADALGRLALVRTPRGVYLPGGGVEPGETPAAAVEREAREECGLVVRVGAWTAAAVQHVHAAAEGTHFEKRSTFVDAAVVAELAARADDDHALLWVDAADAPRLLSHESHGWAVERWRGRA